MGFEAAKINNEEVKTKRLQVKEKLELGAETITATAATTISVSTPLTIIDSTLGAIASLVLADGYQGQEKTIIMMTANGTATVTPTNLGDYGGAKTNMAFDAVGETWRGVFYGTQWYTIGTATATVG